MTQQFENVILEQVPVYDIIENGDKQKHIKYLGMKYIVAAMPKMEFCQCKFDLIRMEEGMDKTCGKPLSAAQIKTIKEKQK